MISAMALAVATPAYANGAEELLQEADRAVSSLKSSDSTLTNFFEFAAGYVVFPGVRQGGLNHVGRPVRGVVYEKNKPVGEACLVEPGLKPQDSMVPFHEAIFFDRAEALENFKRGRFLMNPDFRAVSAVEGAAATAGYRNGVAIFTVPKSGLLETVTVGDQRFTFKPFCQSSAQTQTVR